MDDHMDVVTEALKAPTVAALYEDINNQSPISFEAGAPGEHWGTETADGKTKIYVTSTKDPAAALAHELLHAKLKLGGYRQYLIMLSMDKKQLFLKPLGEILDNELQHHRMFEEFLGAGFRAEQFYNDDDATAFPAVRRELKDMKQKKNALPEEFFGSS
jgi:hypothetical protein